MSAVAESAQKAPVYVDLEQALLGMMMANPRHAMDAGVKCQPALFFDAFHRRLFEGAKALLEAGCPVNPLSLQARLGGDPGWADVGQDYLRGLKLAAPAHSSVAPVIAQMRAEAGTRSAASTNRKAFTVKSIAVLQDAVNADYLVKGLLAPEELSVLYGEPGSGKSFLATNIGYRIAQDRHVFGRRVRGCPVLYVALEGQIGFERRLHALKAHAGAAEHFFWITQSADLFAGQGDVEGLVDAILAAGAKLVFFDTFARAMGAGSENEGRDMAIMIGALDFIRRETGAHVCAVHHCGKNTEKGMRGHSSLLAAADLALEVKRDGDNRSMRVVKSKDGIDGDEHGFALEVVNLGQDDDGDPITSCIVRETGATNVQPSAVLTPNERGWFADLIAMFNEPGLPQIASPTSTVTQIFCLTRDQVRDGFKRAGRLSLGVDGKLTGTDRTMLSRMLGTFKNKGKINMTDIYVWLPQERQ